MTSDPTLLEEYAAELGPQPRAARIEALRLLQTLADNPRRAPALHLAVIEAELLLGARPRWPRRRLLQWSVAVSLLLLVLAGGVLLWPRPDPHVAPPPRRPLSPSEQVEARERTWPLSLAWSISPGDDYILAYGYLPYDQLPALRGQAYQPAQGPGVYPVVVILLKEHGTDPDPLRGPVPQTASYRIVVADYGPLIAYLAAQGGGASPQLWEAAGVSGAQVRAVAQQLRPTLQEILAVPTP